MLTVHRSNRAEVLASALARLLAAPPDGERAQDPFAEEWVVVPSPGMQRWLTMEIAREARVCCNVRFPFPATLVQAALASVTSLDEEAARARREAWSGRRIGWRVVGAVRKRIEDRRYAPLRSYLGAAALPGSAVDARSWGILKRIADCFDDYLVYRQELLLKWDAHLLEAGDDRDWQPDLWATMCSMTDIPHPAVVAREFFEALRSGNPRLDDLPPRICLFGVSTLPPFYLRVIEALSAFRDVHLFTLDPCRHWWGDTPTPGEKARQRRKHPGRDEADQHLEANPLLSSMGLLGRDFQNVLYGDGGPVFTEADDCAFVDPATGGPTRVLSTLQSDILEFRHRRRDAQDGDSRPLDLPRGDRSLSFHSCHSPMRQVEVLRDVLLRLFDEDATLQPRDVVVMTPDIEAYAPLVEAVFSEGKQVHSDPGFPQLPFRIADRGLRKVNPVAETIARVLALPSSRMAASDVLDLLALEPFRMRFGLEETEIPRIRGWIEDSGIRWGIDAEHRETHGQPAILQNTWRFGLDRLMVGLAMPGENPPFAGVLPFDEVEGGLATTLGRFTECCETLFDRVRDLPRARSLQEWSLVLDGLVDALVRMHPREAWLVRQVKEVGRQIATESAESFTEPVDLDAYRAILEEGFASPRTSSGFLGGAITFCAMVPLRAIPFKVVCLLGLDDNAFPRQTDRLVFDRMSRGHQHGDRSPRDDDRYLFLEALLSAREHLAVFFTGQSIADNKELPPAVPVAELLDVVDASFLPVDGEPARSALLERHPLQPFSPRNFDPAGPFSYDGRFLEGAKRILGERKPPVHLFDGLLPDAVPREPDGREGTLVVGLDQLIRFLSNPIEYLLKERLGLRLETENRDIEDREPVELDSLGEWQIGSDILARMIAGVDFAATYDLAAGRGSLPPGTPGRILFERLAEGARPLAAYAVAVRAGLEERNVALRFDHGPLRLEGTVEGVWGGGLVDINYSKPSPKYRFRTWVRHLAASLADTGFDGPSRCVCRDGLKTGFREEVFPPLADDPEQRRQKAAELLGRLLDLYRAGLRAPLPLLPKASLEYMERLRKDGDSAAARAKALAEAAGKYATKKVQGRIIRGDDADPYIFRVLGRRPAFDQDVPIPGIPPGGTLGFHEATVSAWQPIYDARSVKPVKKEARP